MIVELNLPVKHWHENFLLIVKNINSVAGRIIQYLHSQGVTIENFANENGFSKSTLGKGKDEGKSIRTDIVEKFLRRFPDVSARWVILGEGNEKEEILSQGVDKESLLDIVHRINSEDRKTIARLHNYIDRLEKDLEKFEKKSETLSR